MTPCTTMDYTKSFETFFLSATSLSVDRLRRPSSRLSSILCASVSYRYCYITFEIVFLLFPKSLVVPRILIRTAYFSSTSTFLCSMHISVFCLILTSFSKFVPLKVGYFSWFSVGILVLYCTDLDVCSSF